MQLPGSSLLNSPPTREHLEQIAAARILGKKIRRAASVAAFSGWTIAIFAVLTLIFSLTDPPALLLAIGMGITAYFELRGAGELKSLDRTAPRRLAINQLVLGAFLFLYGAFKLWQSIRHPESLMAEVASDPQIAKELAPYENMTQRFSILIYSALYATVMIVAILGPGLTAVYYRSRAKFIDQYVRDTPPWIIELQRAGMSI
jgi:hypothetical protein